MNNEIKPVLHLQLHLLEALFIYDKDVYCVNNVSIVLRTAGFGHFAYSLGHIFKRFVYGFEDDSMSHNRFVLTPVCLLLLW